MTCHSWSSFSDPSLPTLPLIPAQVSDLDAPATLLFIQHVSQSHYSHLEDFSPRTSLSQITKHLLPVHLGCLKRPYILWDRRKFPSFQSLLLSRKRVALSFAFPWLEITKHKPRPIHHGLTRGWAPWWWRLLYPPPQQWTCRVLGIKGIYEWIKTWTFLFSLESTFHTLIFFFSHTLKTKFICPIFFSI